MAVMIVTERRSQPEGSTHPPPLTGVSGPETGVSGTGVSETGVVRVGIVDDDQLLLAALGELLDDLPGFELAGTATTVQDGLALAGSGALDVLVVDVRMPGGGGVAIAAGARVLAPDTAVVALSASGDEASRTQMAAAGARAYLVKDTSVATLLATIEAAARELAGPRHTRRTA